MEISYLTEVLRAGLGTGFSENTRSEPRDKLSSLEVQVQQPIQNRFPFSPTLWDNENESEDVDEEIIVDEHFGGIFPNVNTRTMDAQKAGSKEGKEAENGLQEIDGKVDIQKADVKRVQLLSDIAGQEKVDEDVDLHDVVELKMSSSDGKRAGKALKEAGSGLQEIDGKIDVQKSETKRIQPAKSESIPAVEVVKQETIRVPRSKECSSQNLVSQSAEINAESQQQNENRQAQHVEEPLLQMWKPPEQVQPQPQRTRITEPRKEKKPIALDVTKQEEVHKSENFINTIEIIRKPASQQNPNSRFFTESLNKDETQMTRVAREVDLINKKLDEHIHEKQSNPPEPVRPMFLPKRPPSRNLGGWSSLERNYIR